VVHLSRHQLFVLSIVPSADPTGRDAANRLPSDTRDQGLANTSADPDGEEPPETTEIRPESPIGYSDLAW
jgi:hypothetical protein